MLFKGLQYFNFLRKGRKDVVISRLGNCLQRNKQA